MGNEINSVLFVCMGNICRSPTAEGVMRHLVATEGHGVQVTIDSAGTHAYHVGEPPDPRAIRAARDRGIDISGQSARAVELSDFHEFDLILAMDHDNLALLEKIRPPDSRARLELFLSYSKLSPNQAVPDPHYGGANGFELVLDMLEEAGRHVLADLRNSG